MPSKGGVIINKKQLKLKSFCEEYDIPRSTALKWIHSDEFPAYNLLGHWYVDIEEFYKWRTKYHKISYKYS